MATIMTAIQLQDRVSRPMQRITNAMNIVISSFERMENSSHNAIDRASLQAARRELTGAEADFRNIEEQIRNNTEAQERFNQSIQEGSDMTDKFKNTYDKIGGAVAALGVGVGAGAIFEGVNNRQQALNSYQAQTGVNNGAMSSIEQSMKNLYMDNMGESFDDIANSMAAITQITGQMGSQLERTTSNALLMRDTFQYDVTESVRAADMMQRQFGITGAQAYDQIIQATQAGLNKNGDLLDTINEYSVHFRQLGFNSGQMFNMLINGAKSGTFSVDKLGDAVKEFSIRAIDGSDTTKQGFQAIGLDANKMAAQFGQGGLVAQQAFQKTVNALESIKNPIAQNTAGVNLFGTMWEDLRAKGVFALGNVDGGITNTVQNLQALNNQRYDDAGSALASLGRTINVQLTDAVGGAVNNVKIAILDFTNGIQGDLSNVQGMFGYLGYSIQAVGGFFVDNWSVISPIIYGVATAMGVYTAALVLHNTIQGISNAIKTIGTMLAVAHGSVTVAEAAATTGLTTAQVAFNSALLACPITWIIGGLILLIAVIYTVVAWINKTQNKTLSATGIICGCINVVLQFFKNLAMQVGNIAVGIWAALGAVASNMETAFKNSICNVQAFFWDLLATATDVISGIANKLNKLPFIEIDTSGLDNSASEYAAKAREARAKKGDYQNIASAFDKGMNTYDAFQNDWWKKAYNDGNKFGTGLEKKAKDGLENMLDKFRGKDERDKNRQKDPYNNPANYANNVPTDVKGIKDNTKKSADAVEMTYEDLKYLRDIAERDIVNRFTTAEIKVEMGGVINNVEGNSMQDIDQLMDKMTIKLTETMSAVAEGSY